MLVYIKNILFLNQSMINKKIKDIIFHIFDTETTGIREFDRPIEIAIIKYKLGQVLNSKDWLLNPGMPVHPSARAVHGISDEMLIDKQDYNSIKGELLEFVSDRVLLAHNIDFDLKMIPEFSDGSFIKLDILTLAKKIFKIGDLNTKKQDLTSFKSQELRYWLGLEVDTRGIPAHRAVSDVIVSAHVFDEILHRFLKLNLGDTFGDLVLFHDTPTLIDSFNFGKYKGQPIPGVLQKEKQTGFKYIGWLMQKIYSQEIKIDKDMLFSLEFFLQDMNELKTFKKSDNNIVENQTQKKPFMDNTGQSTIKIEKNDVDQPFMLTKRFGRHNG